MGRAQALTDRDRLVLDSGALIALARGDPRTRALITRASDDGLLVVVPTPVLAQVHRGGRDRAKTDRALQWIGRFMPTTERVARVAGELLGRTGRSDAIVAAEALEETPAAIVAGDTGDIVDLVESSEAAAVVPVIGV